MSPYKRNGIYTLWIPKQFGGTVERSTGTSDKDVYKGMKRMVAGLKAARRWALLRALVEKQAGTRMPRLTLGKLYDAHTANALDALEASLSASALKPYVAAHLDRLRGRGKSVRHIENVERQLKNFLESHTTTADLTVANVTAWLATLRSSPGTRRQYLFAVTGFTRYLVDVPEVLKDYPLTKVEAPDKNPAKMRYVSEADDRRIVDMASSQYRALFAFIKATGADLTVAIGLKRRQLDLTEQTADLRRFKTDGEALPVALIESWAIPYLTAHASSVLPSALLWPGVGRFGAYQHHKRSCKRADVDSYTLKDSRHSVAVRMIARGFDTFEIADQLNNSPELVARVYARHITKAKEKAAQQRREAK